MKSQPEETFKSQMLHIYVIPYIRSFSNAFDNFAPTFWVGLLIFFPWMQDLTQLQTITIFDQIVASVPVVYWITLNMTIAFNWIGGTYRALRDPEIKFCLNKWTRSGHNLISMNAGAFIIGTLMTAFPDPWNMIQLVFYFIFCGKFGWGALEHFGIAPSLSAAIDIVKERGLSFSVADLSALIRKNKEKQAKDTDQN